MAQTTYEKNLWSTGSPITLDKINHMEQGIADAHQIATDAAGDASQARSDASVASTTASGNASDIRQLKEWKSEVNQNITKAGRAWQQLVGVITDSRFGGTINSSTGEPSIDMITIIGTMKDSIATNAGSIVSLQSAINGAAAIGTANSVLNPTTLADRIGAIYREINASNQAISGLISQLSLANEVNVLSRLNAIDGNPENLLGMPSRTLQNVITELNNAHYSTAKATNGLASKTFDSLDARLEESESQFLTLNGEIATARGGLDSLDARLDAIDDSTTTGTVVSRVATLESTTGTLNTNLNSVTGRVTAAETAIGNMDTAYKAADTALDARLDSIDGGSALTTTNGTLAARVEALETEVDMTSTDSRIDTALSRIEAIDNSSTGTVAGLDGRLSTVEDILTTTSTGLQDRVTVLEDTIGDSTTGLAATKAIADAAATASDLSTLAGRVTTLEGKDTIIINKPNSGSNYTNDKPNSTAVPSPSANADYLIADDEGKYFYWRYINNDWELISGAGEEGGGTSSGAIVAELPAAVDANENTDYYVGNNETGYLHYRFTTINNEKQAILIGADVNNIKQYMLSTSSADGDNYIDLYEFDYGEDNEEIDQGTRIAHIKLVGGGGSGTFSTKSLTRITPRTLKQSIDSEDRIYLRVFYTNGTANESDKYVLTHLNATTAEHTIAGGGEEMIISGDPANKSSNWPTGTPATGFYSFDVTDYCKTMGKQTFTLTVTDPDDDSDYVIMKWEITIIELVMSSNFAQSSITALDQPVTFTYIPSGDIDKVAHFYLDNTELGTVTLNRSITNEQTYVIPARTVEGTYQLRAYLTASDNGRTILSKSIYRDLIWRDSSSNNIILSSPCRGRTIDVQQYDTIEIPYAIAGNSNSYTVKYYINDFVNSYNEVILTNTNTGVWTYRPLQQGTQNLRIAVGETYITITLNVLENIVDIAPHTANLVLNFDPSGLSNNSNSARNWTYGGYHLTVSDNFDWYNGGYGSDENGEYFLVKSGTRAYLDYKMFKVENETIESSGETITQPTSKVYKTGQEMKIIFKTNAVRSIDAVWFSNTGKYDANTNKEVGIQLGAHEGWLKTDSASDTAVGSGDEQVAATNTYLYFPYSEGDRIELDININREDSGNGTFAMSYEDGVPSKAYAYTHNQKLYHIANSESVITIGSDDCDVYIYKLRIYNNELTPAQVLRNFIADGRTVEESIQRYQRNCIYYNSNNETYSPYASAGYELDPEALALKIPDVKVLMLDAPTFTENKDSFIKRSTLRCIHAPGGKKYVSRGAADNWLFENGYHAGQGTTSDKYGDAGRNLDFLFNCDGTHKPSNKVKTVDSSYISHVTTGYGTGFTPSISTVTDWKGTAGKISLTESSVPNNFFNFKVNIASSENVNNALLQKRYNDFLPYVSPASVNQLAKYGAGYTALGMDTSKITVKNDMEFVPAVLFVRENSDTLAEHIEFNDNNWHFYALGNLGDSKKTDYTRAYDPNDMNEFTLEISDNNTNNSQFQTGIYKLNGVDTFEEFTLNQDMKDDGVTPIEGSFTAQGTSGAIATTDYIYPITTSQWNEWDAVNDRYKNKAHWALVNEKYDGDHSFEMRYACCGDYRDGKLVNDTTGTADAQLITNSKVWQAFYSWVVTASNEEFVRDLDQWCVRSAVEFWYAFTHYYTMMDNRAKNTFWHFAKTGKYRKITNPVEDMFHVYVTSNDATLVAGTTNEWTGTFTAASGTFDASNTYYTQYAFDLWDYDNDTALGIDNNGELIFPYGKEDTDYKLGNDPSSGFVFNGAGSVFWCRLRDLCTTEIGNIFNTVQSQFFSADSLIEQFDEFQSFYPEALWQVDIQRKYIRPFTGDTSGNAKTRQSKRYLESMMQGRKKYQRRQWIKDQYYYFGSKYKLSNVLNDVWTLDCYKGPDDELIRSLLDQGRTEEASQYVGSNWDITITPYQDMYINASFGETPKTPVRAKAGEPIEMTSAFTDMNNSRIYIYGASRLKALGGKAIRNGNNEIIDTEGLASLYVGNHSIEKTDKLQELYFGTDKTTYRNANLTKLTLSENSPILETLDIRNCGSIAGELKLGGCNNLRTLEAEGTNISLVTLPSSSQITTLHLPSTITSISLSAARKLTSFYMKNKSTNEFDYSSLRSILVDNSDQSNNINWFTIAEECLTNLNYLYLLGLNKSSITDISELEQFVTKKQSLESGAVILSGTVPVTGNWSEVERDYYGGNVDSIWPNLTFDTSASTEQTRYKIIYKYDSNTNNGQEIYSTYVTVTQNDVSITISDIYSDSIIELPTKPATAQHYYVFGVIGADRVYTRYSGWKFQGGAALNGTNSTIPIINLNSNTIVIETVFNEKAQSYPVYWYLNPNDAQPIYIGKNRSNEIANVEYGQSFTGHIPNVKDINANRINSYICKTAGQYVGYKIFNGWQSAPINLTLNTGETAYKIYANWEKAGLNDNDEVNNTLTINSILAQEDLSIAKLLVLSKVEGVRNSNNLNTNDRFKVTMGYDGIAGGTLLTPSTGAPYRFTNNIGAVQTTISPFNSTNNAFTLVIDYKFDMNYFGYGNNTLEAVLAGCYEKVNDAVYGFRLYYDTVSQCVRLGFGDTMTSKENYSRIISDAARSQYRNIIVLRHPKDDSNLYIYSGIKYNGSSMDIYNNIDEDGYEQTLSWSNINTNAKLMLGALSNTSITGVERAFGTIYWAKYWNEDLGSGECRKLANWPHESIEFAVEDYDGMANRILSPIEEYELPKIRLTAMNLSSYIGPIYRKLEETTHNNGDRLSWGDSWNREFANNKFFEGLPTTLQSIISKTPIGLRFINYQNGAFAVDRNTYTAFNDYILYPSYAELYRNFSNASSLYNIEANDRYDWNKDINVTLYEYSSTNSKFNSTPNNSEGRGRYFNLRFPYIAVGGTIRIFNNYDSSSSAYDIINNDQNFTLRKGDILITSSTAYIYVTGEDLTAGAPVMPSTGKFACGDGGWVRAENWWSCSVVEAVAGQKNSIFIWIGASGARPETGQSSHPPILNNYNGSSVEALASNAQGACMIGSFGI